MYWHIRPRNDIRRCWHHIRWHLDIQSHHQNTQHDIDIHRNPICWHNLHLSHIQRGHVDIRRCLARPSRLVETLLNVFSFLLYIDKKIIIFFILFYTFLWFTWVRAQCIDTFFWQEIAIKCPEGTFVDVLTADVRLQKPIWAFAKVWPIAGIDFNGL